LKTLNPKGKIKWEKLDKDLYRAMVTENSTALYGRMRITTISSQEAITQVNTLLTSAAQKCSFGQGCEEEEKIILSPKK
jgi:hypothetical protein